MSACPWDIGGLRVGVEYNRFHYRLGAPFDVLDSHGQADVVSAYASYPLRRRHNSSLHVRGGYSAKWLSDATLDTKLPKRELAVSVGLHGSLVDRVLGGGVNAVSVTGVRGDMTYRFPLALGVKDGSGPFTKWNYSASRDQTFVYPTARSRLSVFAMVRGQEAPHSLDAVEGYGLGGPDGVRAYPQGEAPGDAGRIGTAELRFSVALPIFRVSDLGFALFRDEGWLTVNRDPRRRLWRSSQRGGSRPVVLPYPC